MKNVAVVGASGAVGQRMIQLLEERSFPVESIIFLASAKSAGQSVVFRGQSHPIRELSAEAFAGVDIVLSSTPAAVSRQWSPQAAARARSSSITQAHFAWSPRSRWSCPRSTPATS